MAIDFKTISADTTFGSGAFLFGADSQSASEPSLYSESTVFGYLLGLANTWTNNQTINTGEKTASAPILDMTQTWNNGAVTFTGLKANVTDTASASDSLLMDLQVGGVTRFSVSKAGIAVFANTADIENNSGAMVFGNPGNGFAFRTKGTATGSSFASITSSRILVAATASIGWSASADAWIGTPPDVLLSRKAAASLRLGAADAASPVAQTFGVQSVVAGTTNTAGANFTIAGSQGTGSGAGGSIIFQVAPAGSSGTAQNALATALTINSAKQVTFENYIYSNAGGISFDANGLWQRSNGHLTLLNTAILGWSGGTNVNTDQPGDTRLYRDAANTLALRNGTNAQTFRVYNTYTDASNYERGVFDWGTTSNTLTIGTQNAGSGSIRNLQFVVAGTNRLDYGVTNAGIWTASAGFQALYFQVPNTSGYIWTSRSQIKSPADGVITLLNSGGSDFGRLQFGGTTSSFPALKRSSASLIVRLADDSANAALESASVKTDAPAGGTSGTWKLGVAATVSPTSPNRTIEVDIGGTIYYIHAKTTND